MTRIMRDSTSLADIPKRGLDIVAPYINGAFSSTPAQVKARFGSRPVAWIDVNGSAPQADCLDVETGDATPMGAVLWAKAKLKMHPPYPPIIYCNRATLTPLFNAMNAAGLHIGTGFRLWIATLDGTTRVADMTGVWAVQARGEAQTGGHYDESIVYDDTWKALVKPPPVPPTGGTGPFRHVADGTQSYDDIAGPRNTSTAHIMGVSAGAYTTADYAVLGSLKLPKGWIYYTSN